MRLLVVVPNIISYEGFFTALGESLAADGVEVHVACSREVLWGKPPTSLGAEVHRVEFARGMNPLQHWRAAHQLRRLVHSLRPDLVHAHFSAAIFTTALAHTPAWPSTLATFHGIAFPAMHGWKAKLLRATEGWSAQRLDGVWTLTNDDRCQLRQAAPAARVHVLPGYGIGCDLERFTPLSPQARATERGRLGFTPDHLVFAFVGRFVDFKGFALTVRAFLHLAARAPQLRLLLIGTRDPLHPTGLLEVEEQALQASPQVVDAGYSPDVPPLLSSADAMVFPSSREGMPVCLMEALALGVPVLTRDARGCREVVEDERTGLVVRDCTVANLASAMSRLATDHALRQRLGTQAFASRERFSRDLFVQEQKRIYRNYAARDLTATEALA